jgi:hypothetical protein
MKPGSNSVEDHPQLGHNKQSVSNAINNEGLKTLCFSMKNLIGIKGYNSLHIRVFLRVNPVFTLSLGLFSPPIPSLNEVCKSKEVFIKSGYEMLKIIYMKIQQD